MDSTPQAPTIKADDSLFVKPEPQEDHDMLHSIEEYTDNTGNISSTAETKSARAKELDARVSSTQCFYGAHLHRPHFHRLRCGHDIRTDSIEPCGSNCAPPTRSTGSDSKPIGGAFECPDWKCSQQAAVTPRLHPKTRRRIVGRPCILGHVRGIDKQADQAWDEERREIADLVHRARLSQKQKQQVRKTSQSPPRQRLDAQDDFSVFRATRQKARVPRDDSAEQLNRHMTPDVRQLLTSQKGRHTRRLRGDRLETPADIALDKALPRLQKLSTIGGTTDRAAKRRALNAIQTKPVVSFVEPHSRYMADTCDACGIEMSEVLYKCRQCMSKDGASDYDLCRTCYAQVQKHHLDAEPEHTFVAQVPRNYGNWLPDEAQANALHPAEDEEGSGHCICRSLDKQYMIECNTCTKPFHPGCLGMGYHQQDQYLLPNREDYFRADLDVGFEDFHCQGCKDSRALNALQVGLQDHRKIEMAKSAKQELLLTFLPKLMAQRLAALKRAVDEEQYDATNAFFDDLEAMLKDPATNTDKMCRAVLIKSNDAPVPKKEVKRTKRNAEKIGLEDDQDSPATDNSPSAGSGKANKRMRGPPAFGGFTLTMRERSPLKEDANPF